MKEIRISDFTIYYEIYPVPASNSNYYTNIIADMGNKLEKKCYKIIKDNFGKPFIVDKRSNKLFPISITHSKSTIVVVFSLHPEILLGVDLELKNISERVINRVTTSHENDYICANNIEYSIVWMEKEAISKAIGSGLSMGLSNVDTSKNWINCYKIFKENVKYKDYNFVIVVLIK